MRRARRSTAASSWRRLLLAAVVASVAAADLAVAQGGGEFPPQWYFPNRSSALKAMEGRPAPPLTVDEWIGTPQDLQDLRGKVVVIDFWATWCGPCVKSIPHNVEMVDRFGDQDFVFIGIHDAKRGWKRAPATADRLEVNYPIARDRMKRNNQGRGNGTSTMAWRVGFWPTYFVLDRRGTVRAAGLVPGAVEDVVERLLAEKPEAFGPAPAAAPARWRAPPPLHEAEGIPDAWLEGKPGHRRTLDPLYTAEQLPKVRLDTWLNAEPHTLADLEGKVVLLDFWATWCGPCIKGIPKMNQLQARYGDQGLAIVGICHPKNVDRMAETVRKHGIAYPVCADADGRMINAFRVNGFPDYYLIDRRGRLRVADCRNGNVEQAIRLLLAEEE